DLVGLESMLEFHAYGVDAVMNKATGGTGVTPPVAKLNWKTFSSTGLDISAAQAALSATSLGNLTDTVDLNVSGGVALNVLSGVLVAKGEFEIALGQIENGTGLTGLSAGKADAMVLTLTNVAVFIGVNGALATPTTPGDWSTSAVVNGTLGFG